MQRRRQLMGMQSGVLPGIYKKVEYLESGGNSYINLGTTATFDCEIGLDCYATWSSGNQFYMGCRKQGCSAIIGVQPNLVYQFGSMSSSKFNRGLNMNRRYKLRANNIACYVDDQLAYTYSGEDSAPESGNHILLFATAQTNDEVEYKAVAGFRVYSAFIKKNGIYVRNVIPCVRKSDNKPGMYDTVTKTFYTNAGTSEFIVPN